MSTLHRGRGYVYAIEYHIVWCVKYRRKIITSAIEKRLHEILYKIADDNKFKINEINGEADYVHLLAECSPQHFIPDVLKALKGVSARLLMKEFKDELKKKLCSEHLWNPSYFIATVSENTESGIKGYIESQGGDDVQSIQISYIP
jgi:putative transposase